jgi:hypothetical protein
VELRVEDLHVGVGGDVRRRDLGRTADVEAKGHRLVAVHPQDEVLQVQDDVGDVLGDALDGVELVEGVVEDPADAYFE